MQLRSPNSGLMLLASLVGPGAGGVSQTRGSCNWKRRRPGVWWCADRATASRWTVRVDRDPLAVARSPRPAGGRCAQGCLHIGTVVGLAVMVIGATGLGRGLTATPLPNAHAQLRTGGLYRYARHPIYSGLLPTVASITVAAHRARFAVDLLPTPWPRWSPAFWSRSPT